MKHLQKTLSILLALALCLALVPTAFAADDMSEEANLVFYVMGDAPQDEQVVEDAINAILKEKFNATIDFQFSTWTDFSLKYNMLAPTSHRSTGPVADGMIVPSMGRETRRIRPMCKVAATRTAPVEPAE